VSTLTCLVRTDFNCAFAFLGYYFIVTRFQDKEVFVLVKLL